MNSSFATDRHGWTQMERGAWHVTNAQSSASSRFTFCVPLIVLCICVHLCSSVANISFAAPASQPSLPATRPSAPLTQPASAPTLPDDFAVLKTRNGFAHGRGGPGGPGDGPQGPKGPEAVLVFRGAVDAADHFTAFIEDTNLKRVMELAPGAVIGRGRIKSIDLDSVVYESAGSSRRIEVGQNLDGQVVPPTPTSKPAGPQPPGGPASPQGPPGPGAPGPEQTPAGRGTPVQRAPRAAPASKPG
jgi:hypothetical protein